jgi:type II secretory ATPase GspE/PulE/Tfp pilus assembly ATPase PilB-like protein
MYALLKMLSQKGRKSATLENPIECYLEGVDQFEVKPLEGLTFFNGFKKLLSQNYDAIMIEGIRDSQTLNAVFEASEQGKIIIAPLLDKSIFTVFDHLEEMGIKPEVISRNLRAVINQRLVLRLCSSCRAKVLHDQEFEEIFKNQLGNLLKEENHSNIKLREFQAGKCKSCEMTGFSGHTGLFEVVLINQDSEKLLRNKRAQTKEDNILKNSGLITLYQDGLLKISEGITTQDEINRVIE